MKKSITSVEYKLFVAKLVECRMKSGITQVSFANRIGETQSTVSKIERGERRIDVIEFIIICKALEISAPDFLEELAQMLEQLDR